MEQASPDKQAIALNRTLVNDLKKKGFIQSPRVEAAFRGVLRHMFLPGMALEDVYADRAISAKQDEKGQWISSSSQPSIMAIMLEQLDLRPGHRVLEIGTGPGYNAALMAHIVGETGKVITVEIDDDLTQAARAHLATAGFEQVQAICADGGYGVPEEAPFDRIILTVGAPDITPAWWDQLKPDGRLVLPLLLRGSMKSIAFARTEDHLASLSVHDCGFISLRGDFASTLSKGIQVGPVSKLYVEPMDEGLSHDTNAVYKLLTGARRDWAAGVDATVWEVLSGNLWTWLALHEPGMCKLVAEDEMVEQQIVPPLLGIDGSKRSTGTAILLDKTGVAALIRPPDQPLPMVPFEKLFDPSSPATQPFKLYVRQFGTGNEAAQRLLDRIGAWKAAGCPSSDTMYIRAYRRDADYKPSKGEIGLEKTWTKLVITWRTQKSTV